ncbi:hypothetical protein PA17_01692 [Pseudomonas aeruginosa]|nr:hypothetical protein PA17_01692 [Pseudomonas aeruginosa]
MQRAKLFSPEISHCIPSSSLRMSRHAQPQAKSPKRSHAMEARPCSLSSTPPELLAEHGFASAKQSLAAHHRQRHEGACTMKRTKGIVQRCGVIHTPYQAWINRDQAQEYPKPWQRIRRFEHRSTLNSPVPTSQPTGAKEGAQPIATNGFLPYHFKFIQGVCSHRRQPKGSSHPGASRLSVDLQLQQPHFASQLLHMKPLRPKSRLQLHHVTCQPCAI